jgi:hypothetical protein
MMITAVISDQSLLVQGILSHLRRSSPAVTVEMVELNRPDVLERLIAIQPDVVIVESQSLEKSNICPLNRLFASMPGLVVMEVNMTTSDVQIIRSNQYTASGVSDLLSMLENASGNFPGVFSSI